GLPHDPARDPAHAFTARVNPAFRMDSDMTDRTAIEGRHRVAIENVRPAIDCGRFAVKRTVGDRIVVTADVFADGHDVVRAVLKHRSGTHQPWAELPLDELGNDQWRAEFTVNTVGRHEFTISGWVDAFDTWHRDLKRRLEAGQDVAVDLVIGSQLVAEAAARAT